MGGENGLIRTDFRKFAWGAFDLHFEMVHLMQSCQRYLKLIDSSNSRITARLKIDFNVERAEPHYRTKSYALRHLRWAAH